MRAPTPSPRSPAPIRGSRRRGLVPLARARRRAAGSSSSRWMAVASAGGIRVRDEEPGDAVAHQLGNRAHAGRDQRPAARERLGCGETERLLPAGGDDAHVGGGDELRGVRALPDEPHARAGPEPCPLLLQPRALRTVAEHEDVDVGGERIGGREQIGEALHAQSAVRPRPRPDGARGGARERHAPRLAAGALSGPRPGSARRGSGPPEPGPRFAAARRRTRSPPPPCPPPPTGAGSRGASRGRGAVCAPTGTPSCGRAPPPGALPRRGSRALRRRDHRAVDEPDRADMLPPDQLHRRADRRGGSRATGRRPRAPPRFRRAAPGGCRAADRPPACRMPSLARAFATSANIRPMKVQAYPVLAGKLATQSRLSTGGHQAREHPSSVPGARSAG